MLLCCCVYLRSTNQIQHVNQLLQTTNQFVFYLLIPRWYQRLLCDATSGSFEASWGPRCDYIDGGGSRNKVTRINWYETSSVFLRHVVTFDLWKLGGGEPVNWTKMRMMPEIHTSFFSKVYKLLFTWSSSCVSIGSVERDEIIRGTQRFSTSPLIHVLPPQTDRFPLRSLPSSFLSLQFSSSSSFTASFCHHSFLKTQFLRPLLHILFSCLLLWSLMRRRCWMIREHLRHPPPDYCVWEHVVFMCCAS